MTTGLVLPSAASTTGQLQLPLVLNADRRIYDQLAAMLNTAGYNVLAFDFRGFGGSRAGEYTDFSAQRQKIIDGEYRLSSR
jgi:predicted alpha/beta hydrolase